MICIRTIKKFCKEDISNIENYDKAIADETQTWHCHHRDEVRTLPSGMIVIRTKEELEENGRYYNCPANELIFLTSTDHRILHNNATICKCRKCSEETKKKIRKSIKGQIRSEFARKFNEHYGITCGDDMNLYIKERMWFIRHNNTCKWEVHK